MLVAIPDLLTPEELRQARTALDGADWQDGRTTAGHRAAAVKHNLQLPLDHPLAQHWAQIILDRLAANPTFVAATLPLRVVPPRFNRYEGGGSYGNHVDNAIFPVPGSGIRVRSDVSATLFLSEPQDYDGGELVIEDLFGTQQVKHAAGTLVTYPGSSLHRVNPVTRGARFAAFFWTQSLVASAEQRRTLFDLDRAIQTLAGDHPAHPSIDGLTGVYHNLLRQWSTT